MATQEESSELRAAPSPGLAPAAPQAAAYVDDGRVVEAGRGWAWISKGYGIFRPHAAIWILLTVIFFALFVFFHFIPVIGGLVTLLLAPVLVGGLMTGCQAIERGAEIELAHLFAGFRRHTAQLMLLGLIAFGLTLAAMLPMILFVGAGAMGAMMSGDVAGAAIFGLGTLLAGLITLALIIPVNMALWFAPALVILQDQSATRAVGQSFKGCLKNIVPFLVYGIILLVLGILAAIPVGLVLAPVVFTPVYGVGFVLGGVFILLGPVAFGSVYAAYRDIFFKR